VCAGAMRLMEAQRAIATNWLDVYEHLPQRAPATAVPTLAPAPQSGSASGVEITSSAGARPGGRATVAVRTTPGASCSIVTARQSARPQRLRGWRPRPRTHRAWSHGPGTSGRQPVPAPVPW
jgi:hypothetical protein